METTIKQQTGETPLRTEWIICNACGSDAFEELTVAGRWHIGRCRKCSLIYLNPMPFFAPSEEFSRLSLEFQYTRFQRNITADVLRHDTAQLSRQFETVTQIRKEAIGVRRFLDIGCGSGSSVRAAADLGWEATGIDIDPALVEIGRRELNVNLRCGALLDQCLPGGYFDFIRMRDVIEHLPNPFQVLSEIRRLLVPGGALLIATPNEAALSTQLKLTLGIPRTKIATVAPPHHVHGFTPATIGRIICRAKLEICTVTTTTPVDPQYVTARNMKGARTLFVPIWQVARALHKGSMLIAWARKDESSN